ncbi:hypothetical protein Caci_4849 [Catenulispora acidiphila DSM 44928]|uniref:Uncharacterized protein n=1 Tax=Catenulispora acidiphila (strain DSM 44928 / JCM 14897 / NBRC 102108 / NRRL B-24433 / ID139908) TaxID=479433 RepID=C7Q1I1_CATAD|nr:hypothetical protein [Catenulispora acidiphila]ACU73710.1 hypothetical protein Caci_4849 [Catenulispora acidiphila DSM 44928]
MDGSQTAGEAVPIESAVNAVLVGGPLAGRTISASVLTEPVRIKDDAGVWQEYHPAPETTESVEGHPTALAVFRHYMPADAADRHEGI